MPLDTRPTRGRWQLPVRHVEARLDADPNITVHQRRIFLGLETIGVVNSLGGRPADLQIEEQEGCLSDRWIYYKSVESQEEEARSASGRGVDLLYVHGYSVYGGFLAHDCLAALKAGFRVHLLDMPGHGRSSGLFAFIPSVWSLPEAVHAVLSDISASDTARGQSGRKTILTGQSLGGLTVLLSCIPQIFASESQDQKTHPLDKIIGVFVLCPVVAMVDPLPHPFILRLARLLVPYFGRSTFLTPAGGDTISDDPDVFKAMIADPLVYTEKMRLASALAFLEGIVALDVHVKSFMHPVRIVHGSRDRTTSHVASAKFIRNCSSTNKTFKLFEGYEHAMVKVVNGEVKDRDIAPNQAVLDDWVDWLVAQIRNAA